MTENAGLVFPLTPNVNLYATYSTSFRAANGSAINFAGDVIDQQRGATFEAGFKSDFFNRKLVWNLNWYDLTRRNVEFQYDMLGLTEDQLEDLFNPNTLGSLAPDYIDVSGRREERLQYSRGYESTLICYPGRGWNIRISGAQKQVTQDRSMLRFKALLAAAVARGGENPAYVAAAQDIVALNGLDGREVAARYAAPFTFNFAVNHRFDRAGPLEGLSVGLNGSYLGDYVFNYIDNREIRGGRLLGLHGTAGYRHRIGKLPTTFRLNVRNLVESERVTAGAVKLADGSLRRVHEYGEPRTWSLTATVEF
jgi:outer membrane receptor protein involved in Fe transport